MHGLVLKVELPANSGRGHHIPHEGPYIGADWDVEGVSGASSGIGNGSPASGGQGGAPFRSVGDTGNPGGLSEAGTKDTGCQTGLRQRYGSALFRIEAKGILDNVDETVVVVVEIVRSVAGIGGDAKVLKPPRFDRRQWGGVERT